MQSIVGGTPLIRLERSGEGRVLLKHEGYQPGGSFFDRVANHLFERTGARSVVIDDGGAFALSVATIGAARGASVVAVSDGDAWERIESLLVRLGVRVRAAAPDDVRREVARAVAGGATHFRRTDASALRATLRDIAGEVATSAGRPALWVLPDYGLPPKELAVELGDDVYLELVADDGAARRSLAGPDACRRAQTGQREGILLSPLGAEIVEAAVNAAPEIDGLVVALVPEGGHRYLGWW